MNLVSRTSSPFHWLGRRSQSGQIVEALFQSYRIEPMSQASGASAAAMPPSPPPRCARLCERRANRPRSADGALRWQTPLLHSRATGKSGPSRKTWASSRRSGAVEVVRGRPDVRPPVMTLPSELTAGNRMVRERSLVRIGVPTMLNDGLNITHRGGKLENCVVEGSYDCPVAPVSIRIGNDGGGALVENRLSMGCSRDWASAGVPIAVFSPGPQ